MAPRRSSRLASSKNSSPVMPKPKSAKWKVQRTPPPKENYELADVPQTPVKKQEQLDLSPLSPTVVSSGLKRALGDSDLLKDSDDESSTPSKRLRHSVKQLIANKQPSPGPSRPRGGSKKRGVVNRINKHKSGRAKLIEETDASELQTHEADDSNEKKFEELIKREGGGITQLPNDSFVRLRYIANNSGDSAHDHEVKRETGGDVNDVDKPREPVIYVLDSDEEPCEDNEVNDMKEKAQDKGKGKATEVVEESSDAENSDDENDAFVQALTNAKVPDPFKELLDKSDEATLNSALEAAVVEADVNEAERPPHLNEPSDEALARSRNAKQARHDEFVLRGEHGNEEIPKVCAYFDLREYKVEGMLGMYLCVIPFPEKKAVLVGLQEGKGVPIPLSKIFPFFTKSEYKYVRSFMISQGGFGVANLARCNIYSSHFNWRQVNGNNVLHLGDLPALCYMVGFVKSSSILEPTTVGNSGNLVKDVSLHPLSAHEFERHLSAVSHIGGVPIAHVRCWGNALKIQTKIAPPEGPSSEDAATSSSSSAPPAGRFGVIAGENYSSPRTARKSYGKLLKKPWDHIPLYDLTDGHFDPKHDMLTVHDTRCEVPGIEVPQSEPVVVSFYVSKWHQKGLPENNFDFNLQWVGLLSSDVPL